MAIVGSATVVIRAITNKLQSDIQDGLNKSSPAFSKAGSSAGKSFNEGFKKNGGVDVSGAFKGAEEGGRRAGRDGGRVLTQEAANSVRRGSRQVESAGGGMGNRVGRAFSGGFQRSGASRTFISIGLRIAALVPILGLLIGAISNLVSGLFAVASSATSAAQSLVVIPSLLGAIIQGGIVMLASFQGVGAAVSAGFKQAQGTGSRAGAALAKRAKDSGQAVADAARGIKDAQEAAAEGIRNALRSLEDANRSYRDSLKEEKKALDDLNDSRKEAKERLIDLQFASEEGALAERRASMDLADARWQLNAASELPPDNRLRQEAQLAYDEANLNLREIKERNGDNVEELKEVKKQGINGMDEVVAAQERLQNAQEGVRDALRNVADAERALAKARKDGAEQVAAAKRGLQDAREAQAGVNAEMAAGGIAGQAYADALKNLSPAARGFVEYLVSIRGKLLALRDAGARGLFPGLEASMRTLVTGLFPTLEHMMFRTGQAVGNATKSIAKDMTSGPFVGSFKRVTDQNAVTIERLGLVFGDLARVFVAVLDASRPLINEFTNWFVTWADGLRVTAETSNKTGEMGKTISKAGDRMKVIIRIVKNIIEGFHDLGKAATPSGDRLLKVFEKSTKAFANFTDSKKNRKMLAKFFDNTATNFIALSSLIKKIGGAFARLGANPALAKLFKSLEPTVKKIEDLLNSMMKDNGTSIVDFVNSIVDSFKSLTEGGGLASFLSTMTGFFNGITWVLNSPVGPVVKGLIKLSAVMFAISLIRKFPGISLISKGIGKLISTNKDGVRGIVTLKDAMKKGWTTGKDGIQHAWLGVKMLASSAKNAAKELGTKLVTKLKSVKQTARDMYSAASIGAKEMAKRARDGVKAWAADAKAAIKNKIEAAKTFAVKIKGYIKDRIESAKTTAIKLKNAAAERLAKLRDAAATAMQTAAQKIAAGATKAWAIAQAILNRVMAMNPIGLIITALVLLGLALVVAYKKSETFRNIVHAVLHAVGAAAKWLYSKVIQPVFNGIKRVIGVAWRVIKIIFAAWKAYLTHVLIPVIKFLWNKVVHPVFNAIGRIIRYVWNTFIKPVFNVIKNFIVNTLGPKINWLWEKVVKPVFKYIGDKIHNVWVNLISPAFNAIKNFIVNKLVPAFTSVKTGITNMWNKIKDAAKAPIKFVIKTIYNDGLRKALNLIPGVHLGEATVPFAQGGVLPGFSPGRDIHQFSSPTAGRLALSGGEAIMRPEWTRGVGGAAAVKLLNAASRKGASALRRVMAYLGGAGDLGVTASGHAAFASGGILTEEQIRRGQEFARRQVGKGYQMGGIGPNVYDCSGFIGAIENVIQGANPYSRRGTTATFPWGGWKSGTGQFTVGSSPNYRGEGTGHMAGTLGNMKVESYGGHGPSTTNRGWNDSGFTEHAHLGKAGKPGVSPEEKKQKSWMSRIKGLVSAIKNVIGNVKGMLSKGGEWWNIAKKAAKSAGNHGVDWLNKRIPNNIGPFPLPDNPIPHFDGGGIARGKGWVAKGVARPERMLSPRQTEAFERLVATLEKRGAADTGLQLTVQMPHDASARDVVDGIVYEWNRVKRGGRYNR